MNETFDDCECCPYFEGEGINGRPNCEIFNGTFESFMNRCPQMNGGKVVSDLPEEKREGA